jgi:hypothetical protein
VKKKSEEALNPSIASVSVYPTLDERLEVDRKLEIDRSRIVVPIARFGRLFFGYMENYRTRIICT